MLDGLLFGEHGTLLQKSLQGATERAKAIDENVANVDTPSYKRRQVEFETQLQRYRKLHKWRETELALSHPYHVGRDVLATSSPMHMDLGPWSLSDVKPATWRSETTTNRLDGNNVDIDYEMTLLAQTEMTYGAVARMIQGKFETLRAVIRGT